MGFGELGVVGPYWTLIRSYIALGLWDVAESTINEFEGNIDETILLFLKTLLSIKKEEPEQALSYLEQIVDPGYPINIIADLYIDLGMYEEGIKWLEQAYEQRSGSMLLFPSFRLPEEYPNDSALQAALDKPELNALFEIRRRNLKLKDKASQN